MITTRSWTNWRVRVAEWRAAGWGGPAHQVANDNTARQIEQPSRSTLSSNFRMVLADQDSPKQDENVLPNNDTHSTPLRRVVRRRLFENDPNVIHDSKASEGHAFQPDLIVSGSQSSSRNISPSSVQGLTFQSKDSDSKVNNKPKPGLVMQLTRVPFSLSIFFCFVLIFHLVLLSLQVTQDSAQVKDDANQTCQQVQKLANLAASIPNSVSVAVNYMIAATANDAIRIAFDAAVAAVDLQLILLRSLLYMRIHRWTCYADAFTDFLNDWDYYTTAQTQVVVNQTLQSFQSSLSQSESEFQASLNNAQVELNEFSNDYNNFLSDINSYLSIFGVTAPTFPSDLIPQAVLPTVPNIMITPLVGVSLVSPSTALSELTWNYLAGLEGNLSFYQNLLAAQAHESEYFIGPSTLPVPDAASFSFCSTVDYSPIDDAAASLLASVAGAIGAVAVLIFVDILAHSAFVVYGHKNKPVESFHADDKTPSRLKLYFQRLLTMTNRFVNYVWYKPAMLCFFVSLVAIVIFNLLILGTQATQNIYNARAGNASAALASEVTNQYNSQVASSTAAYITAVNAALSSTEITLNQQLTQAFDILAEVEQILDQIDGGIDTFVGTLDPTLGPIIYNLITCILGIESLPFEQVYNLTQPVVHLPSVSSNIFLANSQHVVDDLQSVLLATDRIFENFIAHCQYSLTLYYCMLGYSLLLLVIGVIYATCSRYYANQGEVEKWLEPEHPRTIIADFEQN